MNKRAPASCAGCVYFQLVFADTGQGQCRRYAPREYVANLGRWPVTYTNEWCGDYASLASLAAEKLGRLQE